MKLNKIKKIMKKNSYLKYILIFVVVFFFFFSPNFLLTHNLENSINKKQITYEDFTVVDTYISEKGVHDFIIIGDNNKTYEIINDKDGVNMYNRIEKGHRYNFVVRNDSECEYIHIIQVYNERK